MRRSPARSAARAAAASPRRAYAGLRGALDRDSASPLLVLASGQRCGSTLVQRLLSSHPGVLIWGEHGGHLREILRASDTLRRWDEGMAGPGRAEFAASGHQGWIANLLPGSESVEAAARAYVRRLFVTPAAAHGRWIWGFKEVRFGLEEARLMHRLFPGTRVIHVTRDPRKMLSSLEWWERTNAEWRREYTEIAVRDWADVNESFFDETAGLPWVESWRYEDLVADPRRFSGALARLAGLDEDRLDFSVFERRVTGDPPGKRDLLPFEELPDAVRGLLDDERVRRLASSYGYDLTRDRE